MLGRKNNVKTILEKDTCVCVCTHAHESASTRVLLGRTLRHLRTFIFNPGETQSCRGPPAPSARPLESRLWLPIGPRSLSLTMEDAARCCSRDRGREPAGTRRAGEAARSRRIARPPRRRARPFPAGPPVSQPRASPPSCAETISRRRDNAKRRAPADALRPPCDPVDAPAKSPRRDSRNPSSVRRATHQTSPPPQPHALRACCAPTFLRGARQGTRHSSRNSFHAPTRRGEARRLCGPSSGQKGPWPRRRQLLQVWGGRFSAAG